MMKVSLRPLALGACLVVVTAHGARASVFLAPSVGAPDIALSGATLARPQTPSAAMYANPAGLMTFAGPVWSGSGGAARGHISLDADFPPDYDEESTQIALIPEAGFVSREYGDWRWGVSMYGTVGATFEFDDDRSAGIPGRFLSNLGVVTLAPTLAWRASDTLSFGASLTPLYGQLKVRFTSVTSVGAEVPVRYTVSGPGVQALAGALWEPRDWLAFGLGVRSPGKIWTDGDTTPPGGDSIDMDLAIDVPAQVFLGANAELSERLSVGVVGRWSDASSFSESTIEFNAPPRPQDEGAFTDRTFIHDANDEWRVGIGAQYELFPWLELLVGGSWADTVVGDEGVSPLLYDVNDWKVGGGLVFKHGAWSVDVTSGYAFKGERNISADEALVLPGKYEMDGEILLLGVRYEGAAE